MNTFLSFIKPRLVFFGFALLIVAAGSTVAAPQESKDTSTEKKASHSSDVRDNAGLFDPATARKAKTELETIEHDSKIATVIETVETLAGEPIVTVITRNAKKWGKEGFYILIDKKERKFELALTRGFQNVIDRKLQLEIRDTFLKSFKAGNFDEGLTNGVEAIKTAVHASHGKLAAFGISATSTSTSIAKSAKEGPSLVVRNQLKLTLAGARRIITAAQAKASEMVLKVNIAVVDDGGHMLTFDRMDGARPASIYTALTKATTAATFRQETGPLPKGTASPDLLLNLSLQNAAAASGGKLTTLYGGIPVIVDGQVIGGVGVGGGTGEQDAEIAKAGIAAFLEELGKSSEATSKK